MRAIQHPRREKSSLLARCERRVGAVWGGIASYGPSSLQSSALRWNLLVHDIRSPVDQGLEKGATLTHHGTP